MGRSYQDGISLKPRSSQAERPMPPGQAQPHAPYATELAVCDETIEVVYRSQVTVTRHQGPLRTATVPAEDRPLTFGVHGAVAEHYGTDPKDSEPHATTLDYLVAAAAG
jgi:hypothetical protein